MSVEFFKEKFEHKSNNELEEIVKNNIKYVIDARIAALSIIKVRGYKPQLIHNIDLELETLENIKKIRIEDQLLKNEEVARKLENIKINTTKKIELDNGNELHVKRLNKNIFQIRIEHSKSFLSPVVICVLKESGNNKYFPFFNLKSILIHTIVILCIILYLYIQNESLLEYMSYIFSFFLLGIVGFQMLMVPFIYPTILKTFKEEFEKRNVD